MAGPFLLKRRACWYLRIRVPKGLDLVFGTHLTRSLKTRGYRLAGRRAVMAAARLQACWQEAWHAMGKSAEISFLAQTVEDLIRADELAADREILAAAAAVRARLLPRIEAAVRPERDAAQTIGDPAFDRQAALTEARLQGQLAGMREAMALLAAKPAEKSPAAWGSLPRRSRSSALCVRRAGRPGRC